MAKKEEKATRSEETKREIAQLVARYNTLVNERQKIENSMNDIMGQITHLRGKYDAYREMEGLQKAELVPQKVKINKKDKVKQDGEPNK